MCTGLYTNNLCIFLICSTVSFYINDLSWSWFDFCDPIYSHAMDLCRLIVNWRNPVDVNYLLLSVESPQYTVECRYNAVQYNMILYTSLQWLKQINHQNLNPQRAPQHASYGVYFCEEIRERLKDWPCYNGTTLYFAITYVFTLTNTNTKMQTVLELIAIMVRSHGVADRDHSRYGLSQWDDALLCNVFSRWLMSYHAWPL